MGKIRTKIIGSDEIEKKQKKQAEARREVKRQKKTTQKPDAEELSTPEVQEIQEVIPEKKTKKTLKKSQTISKKGKKYEQAKKLIDKNKEYELNEAVVLLKKTSYAGFDETVEIHLNLKEEGLKGEVSLPFGTGKKIRVVIADDALLEKIEAGTIDFDILIASPSFMPKLVKYAKILGPKGLMPNPKNGTVSEKTEEAAKKFQSGVVRYKSEAKFPLLHQPLGKISFKDDDIIQNIKVFITAVQKKNINTAFLSLTMSPSLKLNLETI